MVDEDEVQALRRRVKELEEERNRRDEIVLELIKKTATLEKQLQTLMEMMKQQQKRS